MPPNIHHRPNRCSGHSISSKRHSNEGLTVTMPNKKTRPKANTKARARKQQGSPPTPASPTLTQKPTLISMSSPVREGISYLDATKTFMPALPLPLDGPNANPVKTTQLSDNGDSESDSDGNEKPTTSVMLSMKLAPEVGLPTATTTTTVDKILFVISCVTQMIMAGQTSILVQLIMGLFLRFLAQNMNATDKMKSAGSLVCIQYFRRLLFPQQAPIMSSVALVILLVIFILFSALDQRVHQIREETRQKEEHRRQQQEEEMRLSQQRLREQELRTVWQEQEIRKQELESWIQSRKIMLGEQEIRRTRRRPRRYGSANNHDNKKKKYRTQEEAEEVITRMQSQEFDARGTLRSYYNPHYARWFVGNKC